MVWLDEVFESHFSAYTVTIINSTAYIAPRTDRFMQIFIYELLSIGAKHLMHNDSNNNIELFTFEGNENKNQS